MNQELIKEAFPGIKILFDEPLRHFTFTKVGGNADALIFPKNTGEVKEIFSYAKKEGIPTTTLGNASNLIVRDGGIRGFVLMMTDMIEVKVEGTKIIADAGCELVNVTYLAKDHRLTGFEFACGIPGSIGGAVFMNAGAYGGEIKDVFESCEVLLSNGKIETWDIEKMDFSYRHSNAQDEGAVILSATFNLQPGVFEEIDAKMKELTELRVSKQPLEYPSCGSVFKRPEGFYTGALIQGAGLQGLTWGGAQVSEKHAGFIVNIDHATATDYEELIQHIIEVVYELSGVRLVPEVRIIGSELEK
ncbi:MAG: UDP-N-acetylmuramate dehydrogenase [Streptococcaceae bacterium]|jgi:UDP-N-acetylmuramate dehydrogenase|nr:UDP-N-acetylmuramate dehydrogenase [Streptococcaceae bacterium]